MSCNHTALLQLLRCTVTLYCILVVCRLLEGARLQKMRINSGMSPQDLLDSGIDILETNSELYSEQKLHASQRSIEAQLYTAGTNFCPDNAFACWTAQH